MPYQNMNILMAFLKKKKKKKEIKINSDHNIKSHKWPRTNAEK